MSLLQNEITASSVAAEIVMLRAAARKSILMVEGGTDERLMSVFADPGVCDLVISYGRENALEALAELRLRAIPGIICILDLDYLEFLDQKPEGDELVFTDDHDIEVMLIRSSAFDRLLAEMGSRPKLQALRAHGVDLRQKVRDAGHGIGIFRLLSEMDELNLTFRKLTYSFVDRASLSVDVSGMIDEVYNCSQRRCDKKDELIKAIASWKTKPHDAWRMCSGHDLTAILGKALLSLFGNNSTQSTKSEEIESKLRMAFSADDFRATRIFTAIVEWETVNAPFLILRAHVRAVPQR
jgi:hypothetical protein